jgi:hypothetical protein
MELRDHACHHNQSNDLITPYQGTLVIYRVVEYAVPRNVFVMLMIRL